MWPFSVVFAAMVLGAQSVRSGSVEGASPYSGRDRILPRVFNLAIGEVPLYSVSSEAVGTHNMSIVDPIRTVGDLQDATRQLGGVYGESYRTGLRTVIS